MPASAANHLETIAKQYAGTRLERQDLNAELIDDVAGALWTYRIYNLCRFADAKPLPLNQRTRSSPSIQLPKLAMKKIELPKQDPSLPDWVLMSGDMGLKFYRAVCCPAATRH